MSTMSRSTRRRATRRHHHTAAAAHIATASVPDGPNPFHWVCSDCLANPGQLCSDKHDSRPLLTFHPARVAATHGREYVTTSRPTSRPPGAPRSAALPRR
jgi:hypothetical protein